MSQWNSGLADRIYRICDKIFKMQKDGLAFCFCCNQLVNLNYSAEAEFFRHFEEISHQQFLQNYFALRKKSHQDKSDNNIREKIKWITIKNEIMEAEDISNEIFQSVFFPIMDRVVYCQWCNKYLNIFGPIHHEFILHFNEKSHKQFFTNFQERDIEGEQVKKFFQSNIFSKKCIINAMKIERKALKHFISEVSQEDLIDDKNALNNELEENQLANSFQELADQYLECFIAELGEKKCHLEAVCFILGKIGKKEVEICKMLFESLAEEIKKISSRKQLNQELLIMLQTFYLNLLGTIGPINQGYLFRQPYNIRNLGALLDKVKNQVSVQTKDVDYKSFLMKISIPKLNKLSKSVSIQIKIGESQKVMYMMKKNLKQVQKEEIQQSIFQDVQDGCFNKLKSQRRT